MRTGYAGNARRRELPRTAVNPTTQCRVSAIRILSFPGIGRALPPDQVGALEKSCRDMSSAAICRPNMPTSSMGPRIGRPHQPNHGLYETIS